MPICERDPWRLQFFENVPCPADVFVPTDDIDCWEWFPQYRWIYDKLKIAQSQGVPCGLHETPPVQFPVFSKPNINLKGMGLNGRAIFSASEFETHSQPGHMWMELFTGVHVSTDCAIVNGKAQWFRHAEGLPWHEGTFKHWIIRADEMPDLRTYLSAWVVKHMTGYTGMMNFETIGGRIIECHLRFADQWVDLYGPGWTNALVGLYAEGCWNFTPAFEVEGYSIPLFASHGGPFHHPSLGAQNSIRAMPHVKSLQITFHETKDARLHPMPPGGFRLGIVNCTDLKAGFGARAALADCFPSARIMIPESDSIDVPPHHRHEAHPS